MSVEKKVFGRTEKGQEVFLYSITNHKGMRADVINYGATLVNLLVPDAAGLSTDVVTGYDDLQDYEKNLSCFGITVGPNANRIGKASFTLEGISYKLEVNDGENNLHSHTKLGYQLRIWDVREEEDSVIFTIKDEDGCMGFPGNKRMSVTYSVSDENELRIEYHGESDRNTILNPTNHAYFNLGGHQCMNLDGHLLTIHASHYTPVVAGCIPTGEIAPVKGTPMDFTVPKSITENIDSDFEQLRLAGGYDHNWVIDGTVHELREAARLTHPESGRSMIVYTDLPGVQFYAGNGIVPHMGKESVCYERRCALCLETQYFPDTVNHPEFPSAVFGPERPYHSTTIYRFG